MAIICAINHKTQEKTLQHNYLTTGIYGIRLQCACKYFTITNGHEIFVWIQWMKLYLKQFNSHSRISFMQWIEECCKMRLIFVFGLCFSHINPLVFGATIDSDGRNEVSADFDSEQVRNETNFKMFISTRTLESWNVYFFFFFSLSSPSRFKAMAWPRSSPSWIWTKIVKCW